MGSHQPWATGPQEILDHAMTLLDQDTDTNRRLAMILIDNAVEQMVKTYLSLPKRVTGLSIPRKRRDEASQSFPLLLDLLDEVGADKLDGVDLGLIEWYHRQRNQLYHEGFGLTVARDSVDIYSVLSKTLFSNLFGFELDVAQVAENPLGEMLSLWNRIEAGILSLAEKEGLVNSVSDRKRPQALLYEYARISDDETDELVELRELRNQIVHGQSDYRVSLTADQLERYRHYADLFEDWVSNKLRG